MTVGPASVLRSPNELTPEWLTSSLHAAGALRSGRVEQMRRRQNAAFNSAVLHLDLTYSAAGDSPPKVLLKIACDGNGRHEVDFYRAIAAAGDQESLGMLVRCYLAAHDEATDTSNLLMEDLSATHAPPVTRDRVLNLDGVPSDYHLDQIADAVAGFHARWWEHVALRTDPFALVRPWYRDREHFNRHCERRRREWASFEVSADVPTELRKLYEATLDAMPALWDRFLANRVIDIRHLTLSHGDCYLGQFLCPLSPAASRTYLIDFGDVSGNFGAYDLVYILCTFWTREQRHEGERELKFLRRYHHGLLAGGVTGYSWEQLLADYRLMILFMIFDPVWNQTDGTGRSYWWPKMQCLTDAFQDWDCGVTLRTNL
jgi:hypothetical protein